MKSTTNIFFTFLLAISSLYTNVYAQESLDKVIAKVDNYIVLQSELEQGFSQLVEAGRVKETDEDKCKVLQNLLINKLILAKAEIDSVGIEEVGLDSEVENRFQQLLAGNKPELLVELYGKPVTVLKEELRASLKEEKIIRKMRSKIIEDVTITPSEVKTYFGKLEDIPLIKTEVELAQIVKIPALEPYEEERIKKKMEALRKRIIEAGESFEDLARVYCEDGSRGDGGDLKWSRRGNFAPAFEAVVFKLKKGAISKVVRTQFGYHIIKLMERRGDEYWSKHILMMPDWTKVDQAGSEKKLDSLKTAIQRDSITFEQAAMKYSDDKGIASQNTANNGGFFQKPDGNPRMPTESLDTYVYQKVDTMQPGDISEVMTFRTNDRKVAFRILYLKNRYPAHQANLEKDFEKIKEAALSYKKNKVLMEWFEKSKDDVFIWVDSTYKSCKLLSN